MSGFFSTWVKSYFDGKRSFDKSLFRLTPTERIAKYGVDKVAELHNMNTEERISVYGEDFHQYLSPKQQTS